MTRVEFSKQIFRLRTYLALGLMALIPTIMTVAFKVTGGPNNPRDRDLFALATRSGLNLPLAALAAMSSFLLPIVVLIFAASTVSEESSWGTVRYLLVRPVTRSRLLASKLTVSATMAVMAAILITLTGTIEGVIAFGWHPVLNFSGLSILSFAPGDALLRIIGGTFYVAWQMSGLLAFGFMLSTMTDAALGGIAAGMGFIIVSSILDAIPPIGRLRTLLPTHYLHAWETLFAQPVNTDHIVRGILLQVPYVFVFLGLAWWWFHRKDITA